MISDFKSIPELPPIMGPAKQIAYMVDNIDESIANWNKEAGVGPFLVTRNVVPLSNAFYRGEKARTTRVNIAFAYVGDMQLELIELIGDTPGLYKEALDRKQYGVHHYAVLVDDFPKAYNWALDNGYDAVIDAGVDGLARMSYVENKDAGIILEIIEWNPLTRPYFNGLEERVFSADKSQLIHEFKLSDLTPKGAVFGQLIKFFFKKLFGRAKQTRRPIVSGASA
jgi:Glyoxalase/Bleomycin resistance protein/Dioxygenase superfamily